jgi:hypothetical protein
VNRHPFIFCYSIAQYSAASDVPPKVFGAVTYHFQHQPNRCRFHTEPPHETPPSPALAERAVSVAYRQPISRMPADFGTLTCTVESLHASDLLSKWKEITNTLIAYDYATKLHQELNSRTDHRNPAGNHVVYQLHEHSPREFTLSDESQLIANGTDINRSSNELIIPDKNIWAESPDESESVNDIYNEIIVSFYLIIEAADLSQYNYINLLLSFEKIFA